MKIFEIWSEGYLCTGMEGIPSKAYKHGEIQGKTFKEACINLAKENSSFAQYFKLENMTHWGCRLFDNKEEASEFTNEYNKRWDEDMKKNKTKYLANLEKMRRNKYDPNDVKNIPQKTTEDRRQEWLKVISEGKIYDQLGLENQPSSE